MKTIKCIKLDFLFSARMYTWQFVALFLVVGVAAPLIWNSPLPMFSVLFALFAMLTMVATPFFSQDKFTQILPVKVSQRVFGRFLFGALSLTATAAAGVCISFLSDALTGRGTETEDLWLAVFLLGMSIVMVSLEFMALYLFQIKNATIMSLIRMIPAFVFFYGLMGLSENAAQELPGILQYLAKHFAAVSLLTLAASLAVLCVCAGAACLAEKRRH